MSPATKPWVKLVTSLGLILSQLNNGDLKDVKVTLKTEGNVRNFYRFFLHFHDSSNITTNDTVLSSTDVTFIQDFFIFTSVLLENHDKICSVY